MWKKIKLPHLEGKKKKKKEELWNKRWPRLGKRRLHMPTHVLNRTIRLSFICIKKKGSSGRKKCTSILFFPVCHGPQLENVIFSFVFQKENWIKCGLMFHQSNVTFLFRKQVAKVICFTSDFLFQIKWFIYQLCF